MNQNYESIKKILKDNLVKFDEIGHPQVESCEDSAKFRALQ